MSTILISEEAVREKLIDEVGGLDKAIKKLYELIDENNNSGDIK